jgi:large subunit ribosomal protein L15
MRRVPKRGFHSPFKKGYALVNLGQLEVFESGAVVGPEQLHTQGLIKNKIAPVKILGDGKLTKALVVKAHKFSAKAAETIAALGGKTETIADA